MPNNKTTIKGLEQGRAKFAYLCALEGRDISKNFLIGTEWYFDIKYKSYVKKVPALIKTNGFGPTFAFIKSNCEKEKNGKKAGYKDNPKNGYDLIYKQTSEWFNFDEKKILNVNNDLIEEIISCESPVYRAATIEVLSLFIWLIRFSDGLIEGEIKNE